MSFARLVPVCRLYIQLCIFLDILVHRFTFLVVVSTCLQHTWLETSNCKSMSIRESDSLTLEIFCPVFIKFLNTVFLVQSFFQLSLE